MTAIWQPSGENRGRVLLDGASVDRITFDFAVEFTLSSGVSLTIETELRLRAADGSRCEVMPSSPTDVGIVALHRILRATVASAEVVDRCSLMVRFTRGVVLEVPGEQRYEAWQLHADSQEIIIAMPGSAGLAYWSPSDRV